MLLADLAVDFPELRVIAAHMGQMNWRPWAALASHQPNLYGDLAMWDAFAFGHYELFSGLLMGDQDPAVLAPTLDEIHTNLRTWNNVGWCPWTPALWLRILWLGDGLLDTAASIGAQLTHIDEHLDATGCFQDREPFCLMHSVGLMGHRLGDRMLPRFANAIVTHQQPDGGWGEFSYIVYMLLRKWAVIA